jgi:DNA-binding PadR family transcriptional regulator
VLYSITEGGRAALQSWLDTPDPGSRDAFYLRLFVGALADPDSLLEQVRQHREEIAGQLAVYREIEPTNTRRGHDAYHWFLLELAIEEYELKLRWADRVIASLEGQRA